MIRYEIRSYQTLQLSPVHMKYQKIHFAFLLLSIYGFILIKLSNKVCKQKRNQAKSSIQQNVWKKPLASEEVKVFVSLIEIILWKKFLCIYPFWWDCSQQRKGSRNIFLLQGRSLLNIVYVSYQRAPWIKLNYCMKDFFMYNRLL